MADLGLTSFNKLYPMMIRKYSSLIVDQNATEADKINQIITQLNALGKLSNDVVRNWNTVYQWCMNDGLTTDVNNKIEEMNASGELNSILTSLFNTEIGDLTTLKTTAKNNIVAAINENQTNIASNAASLAEILQQNNNTFSYGYNSDGAVQTVTEKDPSNNVISTVTYTYNAVGDVATSVTVTNGKTVTTTYNYDANGNITTTVNALS